MLPVREREREPPCSKGVPQSLVPRGDQSRLIRYLKGFPKFWKVGKQLKGPDVCELEAVGSDEQAYVLQLHVYLLVAHPDGILLGDLARSNHRIPKHLLDGRTPCQWLRAHSNHFKLEMGNGDRLYVIPQK
ncbi:hypothetical protein GPECTOR_25g443 [Gonium pectorale]|uniref:Uncharacterized protein n=1 Tax=Gonium pectorale TaxID=33097 RepID=A0A150GG93_GONPE|nr:hypothetical protein GPECTOR_25g443 [Gonium pectorale]|eukprot:KXZ48858.1 hypothetical protein GPECTOR_25g443 [Gonium pectorale]